MALPVRPGPDTAIRLDEALAARLPFLKSLNPEQLEAVLHEGSPLLILAGAGTGKTRVITTKIAYLVKERGLSPESILAVTFTNKAAREMRERASLLESSCSRAVIRTFHSFGAWFLRRNAAAASLDSDFVIYDDSDSAELIHAALPELSRQDCSRYASMIARAKDYNLDPDSPNLGVLFRENDFRRIYALYQQRLAGTGNVDFGDLIRLPTKVLAGDEAISRRTRQRFQVVLVDEYQDSNVAQFQLLQQLTGPDTYLCVVGDDDQSIYRFRGAEIRNILSFSRTFPGTKTIKLERNYRSYQAILDIAGDVVSRNPGRLGKSLRATRPGGEKPRLALLDDQDQEVDFCARIIREHLGRGGSYSDIAILYRTNAQSLSFEKEFPRKGIPYRLVGALRFYEREEVKDVLAYLSVLLNPRDEIGFKRVVNKPARGVGDSSVETIVNRALREGKDLLTAASASVEDMRGKGKAGLGQFLGIMDRARVLLGAQAGSDKGTASLGNLLEAIIKESGLASFHKSQDEIAGTQKIANLEELVNAASLYPLLREGLVEFLETIELDRSLQAGGNNETVDSVTLITMHNTKGLEFPLVIVTGLEQGLFPRDDEEGEDLEEQRRLFYVSLTRAKDGLYMTAARWRRLRGRIIETTPSRFLTEMDPSFYQFWRSGMNISRPSPVHFGRALGATGGVTGGRAAPGLSASRQDTPGRGGYSVDTPVSTQKEKPAQHTTPREDPDWHSGAQVYHDEYGQGEIMKVTPSESSGPLVIVRFESGAIKQFFPKYTKKLERIRE